MNLRIEIPVIWLLVSGLAAVSYADATSQPVLAGLNKLCPVTGDEDADPEIVTTYKGKRVAFCCDRCLAKFEADPEKYVGRLPQFKKPVVAGNPPPLQHGKHDDDHQHADHEHSSGENVRAGENAESTKEDGHGHDHSTGKSEAGRVPIWGRLHPVIVHFPVAGIPLALLGFAVWVVTGREAFAKADVPALLVATLGSAAAVWTGNIAHDSMRFSSAMHEVVERHQFVGKIILIFALVIVAFRIWRWNRLDGPWRWAYGSALVAISLLVGFTGYLGGSLVFGLNHLKW